MAFFYFLLPHRQYLLGDFGSGAMLLAFGMVCAQFESRISRKGQVVDPAVVAGSVLLMAILHA
jgi:alpha-methylacyl-CoA racemase